MVAGAGAVVPAGAGSAGAAVAGAAVLSVAGGVVACAVPSGDVWATAWPTARTDAASGNDLIRKADAALYASKKQGRNRVSVAKETDPQKIAPKTALHRLDDAEIAGRSSELEAFSEALEALGLGESRFLLIEGAPGMGKSTILETVRRSLARKVRSKAAASLLFPT